MINNRPAPQKASAPDRFPYHFDKEVTPRLAELIRWCGNLVACEAFSFGDVVALVWREAYRLGAGYLPDDVQLELRDWILSELGASILADPIPGALLPSDALRLWSSLRHVTAVEYEPEPEPAGDQDGQ